MSFLQKLEHVIIFTDGITWMFLEERDGEIKEKYPSITLVDFHQAYYKTNYVTRKENEPDEWRNLKKQISAMLNELEKINQIIRE